MSQPSARPVVTVSHAKLLLFAAFCCTLIASLTAAGAFFIGPALAWAFGGLAAWLLSMIL